MSRARKIIERGERALEISAIQHVLKDFIHDKVVRMVLAHRCAAAAKSARESYFKRLIKKGDYDSGEQE